MVQYNHTTLYMSADCTNDTFCCRDCIMYISTLIPSNLFFCIVLFPRKNPQQVFKGHRLPGLFAPMDVCGLYPGESHLGRFGRRRCSMGRPFHAWLNLLCGPGPLIWKQLLWDYPPARPSACTDLIKVCT